jgi:hypothetical protein
VRFRIPLSQRATSGAEVQRRIIRRSAHLLIPLFLQITRFGDGKLLLSYLLRRGLPGGLRDQSGKAGDRSQDEIDSCCDSRRQHRITEMCRLQQAGRFWLMSAITLWIFCRALVLGFDLYSL